MRSEFCATDTMVSDLQEIYNCYMTTLLNVQSTTPLMRHSPERMWVTHHLQSNDVFVFTLEFEYA